MDLINFDEEVRPSSPLPPPLIPGKSLDITPDFSNPIEAVDHLVKNASDPFEYLFMAASSIEMGNFTKEELGLKDGSTFSFDCFSNTSGTMTSNNESFSSNFSENRKPVSRCHSDSSTISAKTEQIQNEFVNRSAENVNNNKQNQQKLLKLSFYNSSNSPLHSKHSNDPEMMEKISKEAKKICKQFAVSTDSSFEDLNNISQNLVDNSMDSIADDFKDMKVVDIKVKTETEEDNKNEFADKIAMFQEQLKRIKQEVIDVDEYKVEIKVEAPSPIKIPDSPPSPPPKKPVAEIKQEITEADKILDDVKALLAAGKTDEVKRQLAKISELIVSQPKNLIEVHPMIREDTFEIDRQSGKRVYNKKVEISTPMKGIRKTSNNNTIAKSISALKCPENGKKMMTPMRGGNSDKNAVSRHLYTAPRGNGMKGPSPYDQKSNLLKNTARKSILSSMDKSPTKTAKVAAVPRPSTVRRTNSLKISTQQPESSGRPSITNNQKKVGVSRPITSTTSLKPTVAVKGRSMSSRIPSEPKTPMRHKGPSNLDQGSLV